MKTSKFIQRTKQLTSVTILSYVAGFILFVLFASACNYFELIFPMPDILLCANGVGIGAAIAGSFGQLYLNRK